MSKYIIDSEILEGLADAIREVTGETRKYTPEEMIYAIRGVMESPTFVLIDEAGTEHYAIYSGEEAILTATADDIYKNKVAVTNIGLTRGTGIMSEIDKYDGSVTKGVI